MPPALLNCFNIGKLIIKSAIIVNKIANILTTTKIPKNAHTLMILVETTSDASITISFFVLFTASSTYDCIYCIIPLSDVSFSLLSVVRVFIIDSLIFSSISVFFIIIFVTGLYNIIARIKDTITATNPTANFTKPFL